MPFGWPILDSALFYLCWIVISFSLMPWALAERRGPEVAAPGQPAFVLAGGASLSSVFFAALAGWSDWLIGLHPVFCMLLLAFWVIWGAYGLWCWWCHLKRDGLRIARQTHALILALALAPILLVMAAAASLPQVAADAPAAANLTAGYLPRLFLPIFGPQAAQWLQLSFLVTTGLMLYGLLRQVTGRLGVAVVTAFLFITLPANFALVSVPGNQQALACLTLAGLGLFFKDDLPRPTALMGQGFLLAGAAALDPAGLVIAACALPVAWVHHFSVARETPAGRKLAAVGCSLLLALAVLAPVLIRAWSEGAPIWPWPSPAEGSLAQAWRASWAVNADRLTAGNTPVLWLLLPVALVAALRYPRQMPPGWLALAGTLGLATAMNLALGRTAYLQLIHPAQAAMMLWLGAGFRAAYPIKRAALLLLLFGLLFLLPQLPWLIQTSSQALPVFLGWGS